MHVKMIMAPRSWAPPKMASAFPVVFLQKKTAAQVLSKKTDGPIQLILKRVPVFQPADTHARTMNLCGRTRRSGASWVSQLARRGDFLARGLREQGETRGRTLYSKGLSHENGA